LEDINVVTLTGRLTKDPELRSLPSGASVCTMRLAYTQRKKVQGNWQDVPGFIETTVFGQNGENCKRYLSKGRQVGVSGKLDFSEWGEGDQRRSAIRITADQVMFLGGDGQPQGQGQAQQVAAQPAVTPENASF
jgi:single-strand DNA-binding protein